MRTKQLSVLSLTLLAACGNVDVSHLKGLAITSDPRFEQALSGVVADLNARQGCEWIFAGGEAKTTLTSDDAYLDRIAPGAAGQVVNINREAPAGGRIIMRTPSDLSAHPDAWRTAFLHFLGESLGLTVSKTGIMSEPILVDGDYNKAADELLLALFEADLLPACNGAQ